MEFGIAKQVIKL